MKNTSRIPQLTLSLLFVFWLLYYGLVSLTNFFAVVKACGYLPHWTFASTNFEQMVQAVALYHMGHTTAIVFLSLTTAAEAILFFIFLVAIIIRQRCPTMIHYAFFFGAAYWCLFVLIDEIFITYIQEGEHLRLLILSVLSLAWSLFGFRKSIDS